MYSILQNDKTYCYMCGRNGQGDPLEKHHIFRGINRKKSEEDGLFVWLCGSRCHREGEKAVHRNKDTMKMLQEIGQKAWEQEYGTRKDFVKRYHKNYLEEWDE